MHRQHLNRDPALKSIIATLDETVLEKRNKIYLRLCSSILSQQLSVKVARVLYQRFLNLYSGKEPDLQQILQTPLSSFQAIGFSRSKSTYVHEVCNFFIEKKLTDKKFSGMADEEIVQLLTQIKGVGRWTAEMILIFTLAREDVFPVDDLGIQQAMMHLYHISEPNQKKRKEQLLRIASHWSPYRSYASLYLWSWKDNAGL